MEEAWELAVVSAVGDFINLLDQIRSMSNRAMTEIWCLGDLKVGGVSG